MRLAYQHANDWNERYNLKDPPKDEKQSSEHLDGCSSGLGPSPDVFVVCDGGSTRDDG